ncbi:MAG TPA: twin-arginine translocase TatA/TatE family subunit [Oligoflexus sp.]|uniref:Sec-independent protein translocase subunit TatA/TatB n=1 Tax=Oligoflexus sp. TaxID=1971216 RepID=UPI002D50CABA|nr:twin-arginine translocase TatA/TatE family subunit [Oligoflexus sp.]HYX37990.1 twin-arginine translocase TatA/TatE family subunit [Oligoflexus sp.]
MPIGTMEMCMIAGVVVLLFGTSKLPKLGQNLGEGIRNFKRSMADSEREALKEQSKLPEGKV